MKLLTSPLKVLLIGLVAIGVVGGGAYWLAKQCRSAHRTYTVDTRDFDTKTRPQDDLYQYVNGKWLETVPVLADKSRYGAIFKIDEKTEAHRKPILGTL